MKSFFRSYSITLNNIKHHHDLFLQKHQWITSQKTTTTRINGLSSQYRHHSNSTNNDTHQQHHQLEVFHQLLSGDNHGIAIISLNRPQVKNAIGKNFLNQLSNALDAVRHDKQVRVVVLQSLVDKVFCAGADLKERANMNPHEVDAFVTKLRTTFTNLANMPMPTISVINGAALGGGLELALASDFRIAGPLAKLGLPETKLAIIPGAGGTQRLPRLIGAEKAKQLIFTGKVLNAQEAQKYGLVTMTTTNTSNPSDDHHHSNEKNDKKESTDEVVPPLEMALAFAREMLGGGPVALRMAKLAIDKGIELDVSSGMALEQACYGNVIPTIDRMEGLIAFKEKRKPKYKGE